MTRLRHRPTVGGAREAGMVTAETAVTMPVLVLLLVIGLAALDTALLRLRCADAAEVAARLAARGEGTAAVTAAAHRVAADAAVAVSPTDGWVTVTVSATTHLPVVGVAVPGLTVRQSVTAPREPGAGP